MADSLGEAFIEVAADSSPFGGELEDGINDALGSIEADVTSTFDDIPDVAADAFDEAASSADSAADDMTSSFETAADEMQSAIEGISFDSIREKISDNLGNIAVAGAAAGAGLEAFARGERDAQVEARFLANMLGMPEDQMLGLISATTNATFPIEDVIDLMTTAGQRGLRSADDLQDFAFFWDSVGDATGEAGPALGEAAVALGLLGIEAGNESEALDALGFVMNNTTGSVEDFLGFAGRVGAELGDAAPSVDEMAAALKVLEDQGYDSRLAQRELRAAIVENEGSFEGALSQLGVTNDAYQEQIGLVEGSGDAIMTNADIFADARTPVENMTNAIRAQIFEYPILGDTASAIAGPLTALGPAAVGFTHGVQAFTMIKGGAVKALGAMRGAFTKLTTVMLANPIFLIGAILIGLAVIIWKFRDEIIEALVGAWEWIKEKVEPVIDFFREAIPKAFRAVIDWVKENWPLLLAIITGPIGLAVKFIVDNWDAIKEFISNAVRAVVDFVRNGFNRMRTTVTNLVRRIRDFVVDGFETLKDRALGFITSLREGISERITAIVDFVRGLPGRIVRGLGNLGSTLVDKGREMIQGFLDGATNLLKNIGRFLLDKIPGWIRTPFEKALGISSPSKVFASIGRDTMEGFRLGIEDEIGTVERLLAGFSTDMSVGMRADALGDMFNAANTTPTTQPISREQQSISVTINNPVPEPATDSVNRELRKLSAIGVFGD